MATMSLASAWVRVPIYCPLIAMFLAASALLCPANADDLLVKYDQSRLWKLERPVAEIIIGNATIADVTIQSNDLLVITGKTFGITNVIALDADRNIVDERRILVQRDQQSVVNLHKGSKRESYNCSPQCNPTITIGDDVEYFDTVSKMSDSKVKLSSGSAAGSSGQ